MTAMRKVLLITLAIAVAAAGTAAGIVLTVARSNPHATRHPGTPPIANLADVVIKITPANGASKVPLNTPVAVTAQGAHLVSVGLYRGSQPVVGTWNGPNSWVHASILGPGAAYEVIAIARQRNGSTVRQVDQFTTVSYPPINLGMSISPGNGQQVGMGAVVIVDFTQPVWQPFQQVVQNAIQVQMSQPEPGKWRWFDPYELHFRPEKFWPMGERVTVTAQLNGLFVDNREVTQPNLSQSFTVTSQHFTSINLTTDMAKVYNAGKLVRNMPVSGGKPGYRSLDGTLIVLFKAPVVLMDSATIGIPVNSPQGYLLNVYNDVAISSDGYYMHAAPWDIADHGHYNVSYGCIELNPWDAVWFYSFSQPGDVVQITGSPLPATFADGEADWNIPFSQY